MDELHRRHYWRSHCLLLNPTLYEWQFVEPPDAMAAGGDQSVVAIDADGRLVSFLGLVPMRAHAPGRPLGGAHLISFLTDPAARGTGVGQAVMRHVTEEFDFLFGRSVTPAALAVYRRLGFRYVPVCERWVAVIDPEATLALAIEPDDAARKRCLARTVAIEAVDFDVANEPAADVSPFVAGVLSDATTFVRDEDYFRWRYVRNPFLDYAFVSVGDPLRGLAVVRVEPVRGRPGNVLRVIEFVAAPEFGRELAAAVIRHAQDEACALVDVFGVSEHFVSGFIAAGGFRSDEEPELVLPHLFQPWEPVVAPPGVLFYGPGLVDDLTRVYVGKGDGNMDWPSWVPGGDGEAIAPEVVGRDERADR